MGEVPQTLANPWPRSQRMHHARPAPRVFDAPTPLRLWHLTSLDAPTVAVVWTLAFAWAGRVALPLWVPILLALAAWAVYIGDRLLDALSALRTVQYRRLRLRHRFHWRHRRAFLPLAIAAASAAAIIVFSCMPVAARERDSVLAAAALIYFTRVHSNRAPKPSLLRAPFLTPLISKEMLVGVLFTAACVLPALTRTALPCTALPCTALPCAATQSGLQSSSPLWPLLVPAVFFALLAWLNCHAIEQWESRAKPTEISAPQTAEKLAFWPPSLKGHDFSRAVNDLKSTRASAPEGCSSVSPLESSPFSPARPALALGLAGLLSTAILAEPHPRPAALLAAGTLSALLLALLDRHRHQLTPLALRAAADLVLLTPLPLIFFIQ